MPDITKLVDWRDEFEIGIPEVDYEHRAMIDLINSTYTDLLLGNASADELLGEIYLRISSHFALEEKDMMAMQWTEFEQHKNDHENLLDQLRDIMDDVAASAEVDSEHLGARLSAWFTDHFGTFDARLHRALH